MRKKSEEIKEEARAVNGIKVLCPPGIPVNGNELGLPLFILACMDVFVPFARKTGWFSRAQKEHLVPSRGILCTVH